MRIVIGAFAIALMLAAEAAAQARVPQQPASTCRESAASFALGQPYSDRLARRARRASGARVVRKVEPGQVYTMEFRADRLNIDVDRRGRVRAVRCG
jgi:hypothetical protein